MRETIGFIGVGLMGAGMVDNLIRKGHDVRIYNRTRAKAEAAARNGGRVADSPSEAVRGASVVVTMLADPPAVWDVMEGERGVLSAIKAKAVLIDSSTISPPATLTLLDQLKAKGADMIDAPVFGSKNEAARGELRFIVGGEEQVLARVQHVLDAMGTTIRVGGNGMGSSAKLVGNLIVAATLEAFNEGMVLATKTGIDPQVMLQVILSTRARSGIAEMKAPQILKRDFSPFFPLKLMAKDVGLAIESANAVGVQLPLVTVLMDLYTKCLGRGWGEEDFAATVKLLESQAGIEVRGGGTSA